MIHPDLDPVVHAPKRLAIMGILSTMARVQFAFLRERLDLSDSDLSKQMSALEQAGYVKARKLGGGRGSSTWYSITADGRRALDLHIEALRALASPQPLIGQEQ